MLLPPRGIRGACLEIKILAADLRQRAIRRVADPFWSDFVHGRSCSGAASRDWQVDFRGGVISGVEAGVHIESCSSEKPDRVAVGLPGHGSSYHWFTENTINTGKSGGEGGT